MGTYGNVVAVAVLRVGVVVIGNLGNNRGGNLGHSRVSSQRGWVSDGDGVSDGHDGGEDGELRSTAGVATNQKERQV